MLAPEATRTLVLICSGVGITPTMTIPDAAAASGRPVHFIHAARNGDVHAFHGYIDALAEVHRNCSILPLSRIAGNGVCRRCERLPEHGAAGSMDATVARRGRDFIGPLPFMQAVKRSVHELCVPEQQAHFEFFGPASALQ